VRDVLELVVRTPHAEVLRRSVTSLRVPTDTGSVGVLPGAERAVLAIEPGLAVAEDANGRILVGTAGGILRLEAARATLLSPLAIVGDDADTVRAEMGALSREPSADMELRRRIDMLERGLAARSQRRGGAWRSSKAEGP